jgi:hypothetical protein
MECRYCSNYHLNSNDRIDDCCLGKNDSRKIHFDCNEDKKLGAKNKPKKKICSVSADCRYCSNYHLNSNDRIDDCCLGKDDSRKIHFDCNEDKRK